MSQIYFPCLADQLGQVHHFLLLTTFCKFNLGICEYREKDLGQFHFYLIFKYLKLKTIHFL